MKKITNILLLSILCLGISGCTNNFAKDNNQENNQNIDSETTKEKQNIAIEFSKEEVEIDESSKTNQMFTKLIEYGDELYNNNNYTKYGKKDNIYFISLNNLESLNYDISIFAGEDGTVCDKEKSGIYFDTDNYFNIDFQEASPVVPILIGCSKEEQNTK